MIIRLLLLFLGLFHVGNGLYMLLDPMGWYTTVPGVTMTGPANIHFISDIALAFIVSGAGLSMGYRNGTKAATLALAGATWPTLHALLHIWGWTHHGFPHEPNIAFSEVVGVVAISFIGFALAWIRARKDGVV